ncbi:MAG: amidohydrolase [Phycisphaeraceae bacterium]|nr:amidohydrolase [Phycisphaeraceae bacterium]
MPNVLSPIVAAAGLCLLLASFASATPPDTILRNATFHTLDAKTPIARAVAITDGKIAALGTETDILPLAGPETQLIDLGARTVIPGLIDAHGHLAGLGQLSLGVIDLAGTKTYQEVLDRVGARIKESQPGAWIIGRGWDHESWPPPHRTLPTHEALSAISPDNPVWLSRVDGHAALANKAAMDLAGIDDHISNPAGGEIIRDAQGRPTGVFIDNAESLIERVIPASASGDPRAIILEAQARCFEVGLTGVHDMGVHPETARMYRQMADAGELKLRISAMIPSNVALKYMSENKPIDHPIVTVRGCKLYMDGAMGSRGAWLLAPYADRPTGPDGEPYVGLAVSDPAFIEAVAKLALERGFQVATHAIGDRANREVLNAYERAAHNRAPTSVSELGELGSIRFLTEARFRIEHAQLLHPADIPRFARLGIIASMQPTHCTSDMRWVEDRVGPERSKGAYAWKSLQRSGARIAGGSDFPVESHNPFLGIYAAITRQNLDGKPDGGWHPRERLSRTDALRSMTIDAAYASFHESTRGSLSPGKFADLIVIDRDIMTCDPREIPATRVLMTMLNGQIVYTNPTDESSND